LLPWRSPFQKREMIFFVLRGLTAQISYDPAKFED
jgi:hypothetical protein